MNDINGIERLLYKNISTKDNKNNLIKDWKKKIHSLNHKYSERKIYVDNLLIITTILTDHLTIEDIRSSSVSEIKRLLLTENYFSFVQKGRFTSKQITIMDIYYNKVDMNIIRANPLLKRGSLSLQNSNLKMLTLEYFINRYDKVAAVIERLKNRSRLENSAFDKIELEFIQIYNHCCHELNRIDSIIDN